MPLIHLAPLLLASPALAQDAPVQRAWTLYGAWPGADYGQVVAPAGDVNGDLFPDLAVGAPHDNGEGVGRGLVVVYHAQPGGEGYIGESWTHGGQADLGHWGGALAGGGDLDGDTFDDLVVAATFQDRRVDVFRGSELGLRDEPAWTFTRDGGAFGWAVALLPDATGDGLAELVIGDALDGDWGTLTVYRGASDGFGAQADTLTGDADHPVGAVLASAGDVDGDGLGELVTAPGPGWFSGAGSVYAGGADGLDPTPTWHLSRPAASPGFGVDVAGAGDVDGDGYADLVVGADGIGDDPEVGIGQLLVWQGAAAGPEGLHAWAIVDEDPGTLLGRAVDGAGDLDQDGYGDIVAGRPGWEDGHELEGGVVVLVGGVDGPQPEPAWELGSDVDASSRGGVWIGLGLAVAGVGDVDLDGFDDVAVGVPNLGGSGYDDRTGEVWVLRGQAWTPPEDPPVDTGPADTAGGEAPAEEGGCGCGGGGGAAALGLPVLLALAGRRRRGG